MVEVITHLTEAELDLIDERAHLAPFLIRRDIGRLISVVRKLQTENERLTGQGQRA